MHKYILFTTILLVLIGLDIGGIFLNEYAKKVYVRSVQNSTCSILHSGVYVTRNGYKVTMLLQQPRVTVNYTQTVHLFTLTLDQAQEWIGSFPRECFYMGNSGIFLIKGDGGTPIGILLLLFLLFDFMVLCLAAAIIAILVPRLGYELLKTI